MNKPLNEKFIPITSLVAAVAFIAAFGLVGESDIKEQQAIQDRYCKEVKAGVWPDYNGNYKTMCLGAQEESADER